MVDMSYFQKRRDVVLALALAVVVTNLSVVYGLAVGGYALLLTLWAGYVPSGGRRSGLKNTFHRRGLAAVIVVIVTAVLPFSPSLLVTAYSRCTDCSTGSLNGKHERNA